MDALRVCLAKLPAASRELLQMRYDDGLSGAEIAGKMQRSVEAVYQALSRVHRGLRECVERQLHGRPNPAGVTR